MNRSTVFAACAGALVLTEITSAAYTGIEVVQVTDFTDIDVWGDAVQDTFEFLELETYQLYATFDEPGDVTAVVGTPGWEMFLNAPGLFNAFDGTDLGPWFCAFNEICGPTTAYFDSWYTIGEGQNTLVDPVLAQLDFEDGWGTSNGGWFTPPGWNGVGTDVLLFQLTLDAGSPATLQFNVNIHGEGLFQERVELNVPAPGALMVMGLAALTRRRRRM